MLENRHFVHSQCELPHTIGIEVLFIRISTPKGARKEIPVTIMGYSNTNDTSVNLAAAREEIFMMGIKTR